MVTPKQQGIARVNSHVGRPLLNHQNTHSASVDKSKSLWWLNIPLGKIGKELHILLTEQDGGLIWLKLPANTLSKERFRYWQAKDAIDLGIGTKGADHLKDIKSGGTSYDFSPHVMHKFSADQVQSQEDARGSQDARKETFVDQKVTHMLERQGKVIVIEQVPARVSVETGERLFSQDTMEHLQRIDWVQRTPDRVIEIPVYVFTS